MSKIITKIETFTHSELHWLNKYMNEFLEKLHNEDDEYDIIMNTIDIKPIKTNCFVGVIAYTKIPKKSKIQLDKEER